ncbi:MAG TPA: choice-of-anchor Q domain-containing protein [Rhodanobacteraceae bacterium]|nr:choice-of-anchor Q domain-containing protein [Rhodanobacteraceae bacterium]
MFRTIAAKLSGCVLASLLPLGAMAATVTHCVHNATEFQSALAAASDGSNVDAHVIDVRDGTYLVPSGGFEFFQNTNHRLDIEGGFFGLNGGNGCDLQIQSAAGAILDGRGGQTIFTVISNGATSGNITFRYLTFQHAGGDAGAFRVVMLSNADTLRVENNLFIDNSTTDGTIDILNQVGVTYFLDNAVVGNTVQANLSQSALRIESGPSMSVTAFINNNTIAGNMDTQGELAPSLWIIGGSNFDFANNIVWNSGSCDIDAGSEPGDPLPAVNYDDNDIDSACTVVPPAGSGTINEYPLFIDAANGNYRLMPGSPARDAGDNSPPGTTRDVDLDGRPRIVGRVDMGAYEVIDHIFGDGFDG